MKSPLLTVLIFAWTVLFSPRVLAQSKFTVSGYIKDAKTGEELIGATIWIKELSTGSAANAYGFYSLSVPGGTYHLVYSAIGYEPLTKQIDLNANVKQDVELAFKAQELKEVEVTGEKKNKNVESVEMSTMDLKMETVLKIPVLLGETDIIKAIQLMPGVKTTGEGTNGFYVRGGGVDQNMILLDEAPVYNASHLMGFFSVFNPDAIKDVQLYKGGIPAQYGGRLSSILDIRMKEGNSKTYDVSGGVGTISSRLTVEGPLVKEKSSFIVSARRTYADVFLLFAKDTNLRKNKLYFYDLNTKLNYRLSEKDRLFISGYFGRDVFRIGEAFGMNWGNATGTARWNHLFSEKLFSNLTFVYSNFDYSLGIPEGQQAFNWKSHIIDHSAKYDFTYFPNPDNTLRFGWVSTYHTFDPGVAKGGEKSIFKEIRLPRNYALEHALYLGNEQKLRNGLLVLQYGVRYSLFQNIGKGTIYNFNKNHEKVDSTTYKKGDIFNFYHGLEPRIAARYTLNEVSSVKANYNRTIQYLHLASNSTSASPLDIWIPSTPNVKPKIADQVALGYFRNFKNNMFEFSVEAYYKKMNNEVDFKDHAFLLLNAQLEGELRFGNAWAYGAEFLLRKQEGKLSGWVGYTLSKVERKIPEINNGKKYPAKHDKPHDVVIVLSYDYSERLNFSTNWVYSTGSAVTMPTGKFDYQGMIVPVYSDRNAERLPAYHRLDLAATLKNKKKPEKKFESSWNFSVYNVYFRKNAFSILFRQKKENPSQTEAVKIYMFGIIPAITYNFKF